MSADNDFLKRHNPEYVCLSLIVWGVFLLGALIYQWVSKLL